MAQGLEDENIDPRHLAHDPLLHNEHDIASPLGQESNNNPEQTAQGIPDTNEYELHTAINVENIEDVGNVSDHINRDLGPGGLQGGKPHELGLADNGPLVKEDSGLEGSEYGKYRNY